MAGIIPAPNVEGTMIEATRYALAMVTSAHASPEDLPGLIEGLVPDRIRQGMVAYVLYGDLAMVSVRELADARGIKVVAALHIATERFEAVEAVNQPAMDRALSTVRKYAEVLDGMRPPETMVEDLDTNITHRPDTPGYLMALTQIAHAAIALRCAEVGEDIPVYLRRISLPVAEMHGNEIEADALEYYVDALIAERLATEPQLLIHAAEALRREPGALSDEDTDEFYELGGSDRLEELTDYTWDEMDADERRLVVITLLDSVFVDPEGGTVADRLRLDWRF